MFFNDMNVPVAMENIKNKGPEPAGESPKVRKDFSQTFLWQGINIKARQPGDEKTSFESLKVKVPDSITSFVISGVSMNSHFGLGLPESYPKLTVFQPFFIQVSLPFSIKRGEKLNQDIFIFNFLEEKQVVTITIAKKDAEFELVDLGLDGWSSDAKSFFQTISVDKETTQKVTIHLRAKILGFVTLSVKAVGTTAGDAIEQKLRVVPEGIPKYITNSTIILPKGLTVTYAELTCTLPPTAVSDTISISASVVGDILGTSLNNLDSLIQMPSGCGEQNMLNFVPDIAILRYLDASGKLTAAIRAKTISFLEQGYQRELTYRRYDGSFSAFGNSDPFGSTWLTGFVVKSFVDAKSYITVDMNVVESSLNFVISKQNLNGSFREDGNVIHKDMQGGSASGTSLTAYIAIVLIECSSSFPQFNAQRDLAIAYLAANYDPTDVYSLAITSYALALAGHSSASAVLTKFNNFAIETTLELHWEKVLKADPSSFYQPQSLDVEISAYGLLTIYKNDISRALKIIRWLVKQQNSRGGFRSTQDTVVALDALSKFSAKFSATASSLDLKLTPNFGSIINVSVNKTNALVLQSFNLIPKVRKLGVSATKNSTGIAIVSLSCNYYEVIEEQAPRFKIDHKFENPCFGYLRSSICISYIPKPNDTVSNMVLVRIKLPSGFVNDRQSVISVSCKVSECKL